MSGKNAPIQIPSELNVPDDIDNDDKINANSSKHPLPSTNATHAKPLPMHRLQSSQKSHSMFNIVTSSNESSTDQSDEHTTHNNDNKPPIITLSPPSAKCRKYGESSSTVSLDRAIEDRLMGDPVENIPHNSTNELKPNEVRRRANSLTPSEHSRRDSNEFDELKPNANNSGSQLRIRSSIISLFGRMGRARRSSNLSQNSITGNDGDRAPPLRALPQIAATKIMRAFSYVGKKLGHGNRSRGRGINRNITPNP